MTLYGKQVLASVSGRSKDHIVLVVELREGSVYPPAGNFDAFASDEGNLPEALLKGPLGSVSQASMYFPRSLGRKTDQVGIKIDRGIIDDFGKNPEAHGLLAIIRGVGDPEVAVLQPTQLLEKNADHGAVDEDRFFTSEAFCQAASDLARKWFLEKEIEDAHCSGR